MSSRNVLRKCLPIVALILASACTVDPGLDAREGPKSKLASAAAFVLDPDCEHVGSTICSMPAMSPSDVLVGGAVVAAVSVEIVDPTIFNTADGHPPDQPYDEENWPDDYKYATIEAVGRERHGPDWEEVEWDDGTFATIEAVEEHFDANFRELNGFEVGYLAVMRVASEVGVLVGEPELTWIVTFLRGGRAEVAEGRHAGCAFEHQNGCGPNVKQGDEGLAIFRPTDARLGAYWYGVEHCEARAAALEAETGEIAHCMQLSYLLPKWEAEGWYWNGGVDDGLLRLERVREVLGLNGAAESGGTDD